MTSPSSKDTVAGDGPDGHRQPAATRALDRKAHVCLLAIGLWVAWLPLETRPFTAVAVAGVVLVLCVWAWRRSRIAPSVLVGALATLGLLAASGGSGWDPARAVGEIGMVGAVAALVWFASRSRPPESFPTWLALGLATLAVWGLWQAVAGLEALQPSLAGLPEAARAYAEERVASRRAFASLPLPSHLGVLLATALPLLLVRIRARPLAALQLVAAVLCLAGLIATRSPVAVGLGLGAAATVLVRGHRLALPAAALGFVLVLLAVVASRPDVSRIEPVSLRLDNWRTAVWLWSTAPTTGAGLASFAQASQAAPLDTGNRPAHAHGLPMEALAELGPAGVVACLVLAWLLLEVVRDLWPRERGLATALVVIPVHNLVDFSLFVSGVSIPWAVLFGWAVARRRSLEDGPRGEGARGRVLLVAVAALALAASTFHATSVVVEEAAAAQTDPTGRFDGALTALELAPWRIEPQFLLTAAALELGEPAALDRAWLELDRRRWWRPRSAALAEGRARLAIARGDPAEATAELWGAVRSGSPDSAQERALDELLEALESRSREPRL